MRCAACLADRDAILPECRIISVAVTRSGTASTNWFGLRSIGIRFWLETLDSVRVLLRALAQSNEMTIYARAIKRDHVQMLISIPPQLSVSRAVQFLKGKSSHKLLSEYQALRKRYWGQHLWARG